MFQFSSKFTAYRLSGKDERNTAAPPVAAYMPCNFWSGNSYSVHDAHSWSMFPMASRCRAFAFENELFVVWCGQQAGKTSGCRQHPSAMRARSRCMHYILLYSIDMLLPSDIQRYSTSGHGRSSQTTDKGNPSVLYNKQSM